MSKFVSYNVWWRLCEIIIMEKNSRLEDITDVKIKIFQMFAAKKK